MESEPWAFVGENGEVDEFYPHENSSSADVDSQSDKAERSCSTETGIDNSDQLNWVSIISGILADPGSATSISELQKYGWEFFETHFEPLQKNISDITTTASANTMRAIEKLKLDAHDVISAIAEAFPIVDAMQEEKTSMPR